LRQVKHVHIIIADVHVLMTEPRCGSEMNATEQTFTTPNYPHNYFNDYRCHWVIRAAAPGTMISSFVSWDSQDEYY